MKNLHKKVHIACLFQKSRQFLALLILFFTFSLQASSADFQITLDSDNITVESLIDQIESKSQYRFVYKTADVDLERRVSVEAADKPILELLEEIFQNTSTQYEIVGEQIILKKKEILQGSQPKASITNDSQSVQQTVIRGLITNEVDQPFPGVTVMIMGTSRGVYSNIDGEYSIDTKIGDTLMFSHIGYKIRQVPITGQSTINVKMEQDMSELSEVIITGIFERKAESFTGSAITVTKEELKKKGNANVFQAIQNIDPSIVLSDNLNLGSNPNALPDMQIRGTATFPGDEVGTGLKGNYLRDPNQPLFILNGFEVNVEQVFDLDINRIEKVTVLKDAASKALYGSRAANGVVVIETTQLSSEKALITYNASVDLELPDLDSYNLTNSLEKLEAERIDGLYIPSNNDPERLAQLQQLYNSRLKLAKEGLDTDWMAKPLRNGIGQRHSLTAELGGEELRILGNIAYRDVQGVMKESFRKNLTGSLTASYRLDNFSFRNIMTVNSNNAQESPYGIYADYVKMNPYWKAEEIDGTIPYYAEIGPNGERYTNPLYNSTLDSKITSDYLNFINNFYLEWRIIPSIRATARIGIDVKKNDADEFYPSKHTLFENYYGDDAQRKGSYQVNNGESSYVSGDLNVQYSKNIGKHFVFSNLGFNISERKFNEVVHQVEGFPSNRMDNIIFARDYVLDSRPTGIEGLSRDIGFLAVGSYVYDNRFLSDVTLRTSASSQFGADKKWANFWSLGLGWNIHNESFLENSKIKELRLRGSLGSTGNQNFNTNESIATYNYFLESLYQGFPGSYVQNMANPFLQWETKFDYNAGIDSKIGNLSLRLDYYESYTENLITSITLPYSTGFNSVKDNLGKVKNSGIEANLSMLLWSQGRNFFSVNGGIATNENKIVELSNAMRSFNERMDEIAANRGNSKPVNKYEDGMSMNAIWAVPSLGIDPSTGNEVYLDREGNTTYEWSARDMVVVGDDNPKYRGNFGFSGEYNGFGISVTARYLGGGQMYNQTLIDRVENVDMNYNVDRRVLTGRWLEPGQQALFKRLGTFSADTDGDNVFETFAERTRATSRFVQDRNELDIAAVNVYYEFSDNLVDYLNLNRLRLSFNMNEAANFSSVRIERGTDYPFARNMSFSLMATF
ncbi:SusC/RagA family TonB-linked outer membrane protein [uncultured Salegentibacter sp.]|uniref:SusC/RagA family TonB-linked outer membrane protein n=1 Tax=uncultured Salegentibacter sp. TaxID=259320 RepID=UPI0025927B3E|nr:SusC/RagA family TonB-linked outer membrane protein [uncultured Salegentibacter sp.]